MPTVITGTDGINQVQAGAVESGDLPAGSVIQVQSVVQTQVASASGTTDTGTGADLGLSLTITPKADGSYFYITADIGIGTTTSGNSWGGILSRDGTRIGNTTNDGFPMVWFRGVDHAGNDGADLNHGLGASGSYMDTSGSTAGTSITFKCGFAAEAGSVKINEVETGYSGSSDVTHSYTVSTFTVMEILQ